MKTITVAELHAAFRQQGVDREEHICFICPKCGAVQCAQDLIEVGAGKSLGDVEQFLGFSCVGRWTERIGCDWTLGGLLQLHEVEVKKPDGTLHPSFAPATPEQAQAHLQLRASRGLAKGIFAEDK